MIRTYDVCRRLICLATQDTLHKVEHKLFDSTDEEGAKRKAEDAQRDQMAEAKLEHLQRELLPSFCCAAADPRCHQQSVTAFDHIACTH